MQARALLLSLLLDLALVILCLAHPTQAFAPPASPIHRRSPSAMAALTDDAAALQLLSDLKTGKVSVADLLGPLHGPRHELTPGSGTKPPPPLPTVNPADYRSAEECDALPESADNKALVANVHPPDYKNPEPLEVYDLVVIGAGVAGLLSVIMGKALGLKCALVERHYMGGDCLNVGCVPSKALIAAAQRVHDVRASAAFGVRLPPGAVTVDFPAVMDRMREIRAKISSADSVARYARDFCEHVFLGSATFTGAHNVAVAGGAAGDRTLRFRKAMVATGGSAGVPAPFAAVPHLTNANVFNLEALPRTLCVVGAGPIGLELAQCFARFGAAVTVLERGSHVLPREDPDAARLVQASLEREGVRFVTDADVTDVAVTPGAGGLYRAPFHRYRVSYGPHSGGGGGAGEVQCEAVLVAAGRVPNVLGLGLEAAGVQFDARRGVIIDDCFQSTAPHIYACGDCATPYKFTHAADWQARAAIRNMFLGARERLGDLLIPWCTYTDPEVAHVGLYEPELKARGLAYETYTRPLADVDRCRCEGVTEGFVKLFVASDDDGKQGEGGRGGQVLGATIVGPHAGDMVSEVTLAMQCGIGAGQIAGTIHPYPTQQEAVRQAAAQYNKRYRTPTVNRALDLLLQQRRALDDSSDWWKEVLAATDTVAPDGTATA